MLLFPIPKRLNIKSYVIRQTMHGLTQCVSVIFSIVGIVAVFRSKDEGGHLDFYSVHSWLGMTSAMLFFLQVKQNYTTVYVFTAVLELQQKDRRLGLVVRSY